MPLGEPVPLLAGPGEDLIGARRQAGDGVRSGTGLSERCRYRPGIFAGRVVGDHVHTADVVEDLARDIPGLRKDCVDPRGYLPFLDLDRLSSGDKRCSRIIQRDEAGGRDRPRVEKDLPGTGRNARVGVVSLRIRLGRPEGDARRIDDGHLEAAEGIAVSVRHTAGDGPPIPLLEPRIDALRRPHFGRNLDRIGRGELDPVIVPFVDHRSHRCPQPDRVIPGPQAVDQIRAGRIGVSAAGIPHGARISEGPRIIR